MVLVGTTLQAFLAARSRGSLEHPVSPTPPCSSASLLKIFGYTKLCRKKPTGFNISIAKYSPTFLQAFAWIGHDLSQSALALLKNYTEPTKSVSGKSYPVVTAHKTIMEAMLVKIWIKAMLMGSTTSRNLAIISQES
ncbi:hypothetical protein C8R44DRAFT_735974 [Mycena epipterygia]|nr:hypothetical protein C8R44DRAFT_735974 [Mycena epipterygia]